MAQLVKLTWSWLLQQLRLQRMLAHGVQEGHPTLLLLVEFLEWALTLSLTRMVLLLDLPDPRCIIKLHFSVQRLSNIWQPCLSMQVFVEHCSGSPPPSRLWLCLLEVWLLTGDGLQSPQRSEVVSNWLDCLAETQMVKACGFRLAPTQSRLLSISFALPEVSSSGTPTTLTSSSCIG